MRRERMAATRLTWRLLFVFGILLTAWSAPAAAQTGSPRVLTATVDGAITPVIADYLDDSIERAEQEGYQALVVRLDTPGGLDVSMRDIVKRFLAADVPIVVYVSPDGARAASAGALITFAAHIAAMAPGTSIGASTPVDLEGGEISDKIINDAAAFAESIAEVRGRNVEFAVDTVREGRSATVTEAVGIGAVDLASSSLTELLESINERRVVVGPAARSVTLDTAGAEVVDQDMGFFRRIQQILADPNIAFLFLSIGTLGLIYELASPGIGAGGTLGTVMILLALFGVSVLPVNVVGLLLLVLAAALFVAELFAPGVGVAAAGGTLALVLSGVFLFRDTPGLDDSGAVIGPVAIVVGGGAVLAGRVALRSRHLPSSSSQERFVGQILTVGRAWVARRSSKAPGGTFAARPARSSPDWRCR
ncbi:MAG: nodulation protein NfeD [Actinobacteria bacterium]|nr:nodulation protein NfeD [Actinomycetota bacterium]